MPIIEVNKISKVFETVTAVDGVSFSLERGEFFGLLGPNGAGKTTTIRILLDIFKPDQGTVSILGGPMDEAKKNHIGYMPEERGLYQDLPLERVLSYLAALKGLSSSETRRRLDHYLQQFDLTQYRRKKVKELSKGMQQKAQLIVTMIHQPELLIIDEPFSGLDPVNTQMVKDMLRELHHQGTTIIMSTHQMHQVEELCERILLMHHGRVMLYGPLNEIRRRFSGHAVLVYTQEEIPGLPGVESIEQINGSGVRRLTMSKETNSQEVLRALVQRNICIEQFEIAVPTLDEIFIQVVKESQPPEPGAALPA